ncbi:hypothetical protein [Paenibacillus whitsoniae]|uniref:Uncharacterized protein n=1 Tax=Paenibacillus whitsoniae TaxID=2496558 RepID=A0A3S0AKD6_9BACL|nr:hypothetical protein [Paenibacillus whitsoniae]RTE03034.1 hypothetical protein EJQ19_28340 [Paenibacillus whitsoniae]
MDYAFAIQPASFTRFEEEAELTQQCKVWGLISEKATKAKTFYYKRSNVSLTCSIVGYVDAMTAVIELDSNQLHCIHPSYLKEMQAASFGQRNATASEDGTAAEEAEQALTDEAEAPKPAPEKEKPKKAAAPKESKPKKEKAAKLQLPEEKVKMKATITEFATVPNHFTETDDEVIIYEAVSILDPDMEIGTAWSSYSNTLKKLELAVGDTLTFECKIVAKKLAKHPVPYKINNPAKMQKVTD